MATNGKMDGVAERSRACLRVVTGILLFLVACAPNQTYDKMHPIDRYQWYRGDTLDFDVSVDDTTAFYDLYITFRHNNDYPFSNLWFYLHTYYPSGKKGKLRKQITLADNKELKWKGECMSNICSVKIPIVQDLHLSEMGTYQFRISHVMRTNPLPGVMDVGLQFKKHPTGEIERTDTTQAKEKNNGQPRPVNLPAN